MRVLLLSCFAVIFFISVSCSPESEPIDSDVTVTSTPQMSSTGSGNSVMINPNRANYDIVIVDIDRWEICLNFNRVRSNISSLGGSGEDGSCDPLDRSKNTIDGEMWYQVGSYVFEGKCTAMYNPVWDMITVVALDAGWDRGHIVYNLTFVDDNSNNMEGTFYYHEFPNRVNWVDAWLDQGKLGTHDAGPPPGLQKRPAVTVPNEHPKKLRAELPD